MKNTLVMAGLAAGLVLAPFGLASAHFANPNGVASVTVKCGPNLKAHHKVMFVVFPKRHSFATYQKVRCGTTKVFKF